MNILGLISSILIILSFSFLACVTRQSATRRIQKTFESQTIIHRKLLALSETEHYKSIRAVRKNKISKPKNQTAAHSQIKEIPKPPAVNPECARLNLWPLLTESKEEHPLLYEQCARLFRRYYQKHLLQSFSDQSKTEYRFLDSWLAEIKKEVTKHPNTAPVLEKISLKDQKLQTLYYYMLRGSKGEYPPLLDFLKAIPDAKKGQKVCLLHATPTMLSVFFGDAAEAVYQEMHKETLAVTEERIEQLCREHHEVTPPKELFHLLSLSRFKHPGTSEITLWEEDKETRMEMRQKVHRR